MIDKSQNPASFIRAFDSTGKIVENFNTNIHGNVLSIYSDNGFADIQTISMEEGLKSTTGIHLAKTNTFTLSDRWDLPEVKFANSNVILPTTQGAVLPIQTKNLTGVLVQVYAVYERNINQFMQDNEDMAAQSMLYRVGEPVWEKKISFKWENSMQNAFITNGLDLSSLVKKYPNGMLHVRVTFRPDQIKYVCNGLHDDFSSLPMPADTIEVYSRPNEKSSWDYWEDVNNSDRRNYSNYRNDPCHPAFYMPGYNKNCIISRNVLVSDLGIMAKRDNNGTLFVTVTNLITAEPKASIPVEVRNYVGSVIATARTDENGCAVIKNADKAFIVTASENGQTSYLKIAELTNLSVSHFEIGGEKSTNGVKGFIYGERGVWRPGDNLYLTFVLQDLKRTLPENIPVKFELIDPLGKVVDSQNLTESLNGFYPIVTKTDSSAKTGSWTGRVRIGGKTWTKNLSIETVVPNHLSVDLLTDNDYLQAGWNNFTINSSWLHGAPTPSYKAEVSVAYSKADTAFDGYVDYTFTSVSRTIETYRKNLWSGYLDENSTVNFSEQLNAGRDLPGKINAHFISKVYEPAGGFSTQSKTMVYSPYSRYVGLKLPKGDEARNMLLTDVYHTGDVVLLDSDGNPIDSASLDYTVYKIEWKWWWEKDAYTSATHVSSWYYDRVASGKVDIESGKGSFEFQVKYPSWGRYLVEVQDKYGGHCASKIVYIDWPGWAGRAQDGGSGSASMVPLTVSKKSYLTGETAEVTFTSSSEAMAYITLEKGGTVIKQQMMRTVKGTNYYRFSLTPEMSPNVYVHVSLVQPHMQTANSLPIRLYGVVPVIVDNPATKLCPEIECAKSFEPNAKAKFKISEKSGHPMTYTIAIVDEGLLGLTNFHGADLRNEFYKKEASELESWDIFRYVINAFSGKLETILAIGGSEEINSDNSSDANRWDTVVKYFGPFYLKEGETKEVEFMMPNYIGAVRAMVIAGDNGAYALAEKTVPVKSALMVQASIPRTIGCNESITIPVNLFNGDDFEKECTLKVDITGAVTKAHSKKVKIPAMGSLTTTFDMDTIDPGISNVIVSAIAGKDVAVSAIPVTVESRGIPVTYKTPFIVKPKKTQQISVNGGAEKGTDNLRMELSLMPQIDLSSRLEYLTQYPHGCIEQITSGAFPQIFLSSYMQLDFEDQKKIRDNVQSVFERYSTYQTSSGAMGYWPGNQEPHAWGTCYSSHFMVEAKNKGYAVPDNILNSELDWLSDTANQWNASSNDSASVQAYRLFVLALARRSNVSAMNRLESVATLNTEAKLLLAAAYANIGRKDKAMVICKSITPSESYYREMDSNFSSSMRENALYLYACVSADFIAKVPGIAKKIAETLSSDNWLSTQETAWMLYAMLPYYSNQTFVENPYSISCNNVDIKGIISKVSKIEELDVKVGASVQQASLKNEGKSNIYGSLIYSGRSIPGSEITQNEGLYMTVTGLDKKTYTPGETVEISVSVRNNSDKRLTNLALTVPVPTCFEFANERLADQNYTNSNFAYQDIRDDCIYTYFDLSRNQTAVFKFVANVAYTGNFYIPAIHVEAMYDDSIKAVRPGKFVMMK